MKGWNEFVHDKGLSGHVPALFVNGIMQPEGESDRFLFSIVSQEASRIRSAFNEGKINDRYVFVI